jgi:catechol 2,3-dioxygenase-like lactoylglutathione lyase family enzyme
VSRGLAVLSGQANVDPHPNEVARRRRVVCRTVRPQWGDTEVHLQGAVMHVSSLDRAIDFYTRLLDLEVARRTADAAILATHSGTPTIALRERPVQVFTDRTVEALVWRLPTIGQLDDLEQRLGRLMGRPTRHVLADDAITLLSARAPDGQRLLFVHHGGENDVPGSIPAEVFWY